MSDAWDDIAVALGPVAYWPLDEASGSRADLTGNGHTASEISSVGQGTMANGFTAADFTGSPSELRATDAVALRPEGYSVLSCSWWAETTTFGATRSFFSKYTTSGVPDSGIVTGMWSSTPDTEVNVRFGGGSGGGQSNPHDRFQTKSSGVPEVITLESGVPLHMAFVLTFGASGGIQWYLNGQPYDHNEYGNNSFTWGSGTTIGQNFRFGTTDYGTAYDGLLAKVAWFDRALTDEEVLSLYTGSAGGGGRDGLFLPSLPMPS